MQSDYARYYCELYRRHWFWRAREDTVVDTLRRRRFPRGGAILDIGCGDGLSFARMAEFGTVEGVEPDASLVTEAGPYRGRITIAPFDRRFQPGRRYRLILMLDVLEHLDEPTEALRHALELLAPQGLILITVPAFQLLWTTHDAINHHRLRYTKRSFERMAAAASFHIDDWRYVYQWLFPLKLLVRLKERIWSSPPGLPRIPSEPVNRLLYGVASLERRLLAPARLPFGSALLVVGGAPPR